MTKHEDAHHDYLNAINESNVTLKQEAEIDQLSNGQNESLIKSKDESQSMKDVESEHIVKQDVESPGQDFDSQSSYSEDDNQESAEPATTLNKSMVTETSQTQTQTKEEQIVTVENSEEKVDQVVDRSCKVEEKHVDGSEYLK